jgi:uncharacterized repeat protein (TIGR01451 family)
MRARSSTQKTHQRRSHEKRGERQKQADQTLWSIKSYRIYGLLLKVAMLTILAAAAVVSASMQTVAAPETVNTQSNATAEAIIVDHSTTDITAIPQAWIEEAKRELHIFYGHTSHGHQLTQGMAELVSFANNGGLGLALPQDIFAFNNGGTDGALDLREVTWPDAGLYPQWVDETRAYLGTPDPATGRGSNNPEINVVMWAWCGEVSFYTEQQMLDSYLLPMTQLEEDYFGITFVYMTGHADGTGEEGNLHLRNQQIREYCIQNDKVLYDFYHIELYDPDGTYYGDKLVNDQCDYDSDGDGILDRIWCLDWQNRHVEGVEWYTCDCSHSYPINCNQKAYAAWWLWARLAGWDSEPLTGPQKTASPRGADYGDAVTYTILIQNLGVPATATVDLTDVVPQGLVYVPDTLTATSGAWDDTDAPTLQWSGTLEASPTVTIAYSATIEIHESEAITNNAVIASPGYGPVTITTTILANPHRHYLPLVLRND